MIPAPEITNLASQLDYLQAVQLVTGVWQREANIAGIEAVNRHIARMWTITFTPEQQQAIVTEFIARRLAR